MAKKKAAPGRTDRALLKALGSESYSVYGPAQEELEAWFAAHPDEAVSRATRIATLALASKKEEERRKAGTTVLWVIADALPKGAALPAKWDPLVSAFGQVERHRRLLGTIPIERRTKIFAREFSGDTPNATNRILEFLLDLAPAAARTLLERAEAEGTLGETLGKGYLVQWKKKVPEVAALLKEFAPRAKKEKEARPPPPPKIPGTLSFRDGIAVEPSDYPTLDAVAKAQYRVAAERYLGGKVRDAKHFVRRLEADDMNAEDASMRRWRVFREREHLFDFWIVWVDNGTLFEANRPKAIPVHQIQGSFQALDKKPSSKALADDFQRSAPSDLWTVPRERVKRR